MRIWILTILFNSVVSLNIAILGVTGRTGVVFAPIALKAGHKIRALIRNPKNIDKALLQPEYKNKVTIIEGDINNEDAMDKVVKGADIVICTLGASANKPELMPVFNGTRNAVRAMKKFGVRKYVVISTVGTVPAFQKFPFLEDKFMSFALNHICQDHINTESFLSNNTDSIDWVTLHPPFIVPYAKAVGYELGVNERVPGDTSEITQNDLAQALYDIMINTKKYKHTKLHVTSTKRWTVERPILDYYAQGLTILWDAFKDKVLFNPRSLIIFFFVIYLALRVIRILSGGAPKKSKTK